MYNHNFLEPHGLQYSLHNLLRGQMIIKFGGIHVLHNVKGFNCN